MTHFIVAVGILYLNESIATDVIITILLTVINTGEREGGGGCDLFKYLVIYYISSYFYYIV